MMLDRIAVGFDWPYGKCRMRRVSVRMDLSEELLVGCDVNDPEQVCASLMHPNGKGVCET